MMKFVRVDEKYIAALRNIEEKVQDNSSERGKGTKPFLGVLFSLTDSAIEYYVPISSYKAKHFKMKNGNDFHKIFDDKGNLLAVLNFNNMIPVTERMCSKIDFNTDKDKYLLLKEYAFCKNNETVLKKKAQKLYDRFCSGSLSEGERARTNDFKKMEEELKRYIKTIE